ncbi:MAG: hypothetical protein QOE54_291 [Streptosporangiaceae bacterium]|jgi:hypothetical protein|nr:hypothetical protein [Streptosporangiaceae bacterium]MDX6427925.1 hypothetical protein [Streptosporangiaceae bacterium]
MSPEDCLYACGDAAYRRIPVPFHPEARGWAGATGSTNGYKDQGKHTSA